MPLAAFSLTLVVFGLTTGEFVIAGILPDVASHLAVSVSAAGLLVTAYAIGMIVGGPTVSVLTARVPRKRLIAGLAAAAVIGNLVSAAAPTYATLLIGRFVSGLPVATLFAVAIATAVSMAAPGKHASAVAKVALGLNLGIVLGAPLGTLVGHRLGWRVTFAAVAAIALLALVLVLRSIPSQPASAPQSAARELHVLADRGVQLAIALTAVGNVGVVMVFTYIASLLTKLSGFSSAAVPLLLLLYGAGAVIGNFAGGWLSDKALMPALTGLLGALSASLLLLWLTRTSQILTPALVFVVGALAFSVIPGMQTRVMTTASSAPTLAVAVNASGFQLASALAGWLGGVVISSSLGLRSVYLVGALLTLAGTIVALYNLRRDRALSLATNVAAADAD